MEENALNICTNCEKPYPQIGFYCGGCLTQFKCKSCNAILNKDDLGCVMCGTPKDIKRENQNQTVTNNVNTIRLHESLNERTIEATFSDNVGKDLTGMIKDAYQSKMMNIPGIGGQIDKSSNPIFDNKEAEDFEKAVEIETVEHQNFAQKQDLQSKGMEYPTIMLVTINNLPNSEVEWILVYSFYASNFGKDIFTRKAILDAHNESKRKNNNVSNNLTRNINLAINAGYINPLQEGYALLQKGIEKANEIVSRTIGSIPKVQANSSKKHKDEEIKAPNDSKNKNTTNNSEIKSLKILSDIDFFPENSASLKDFYEGYNSKNDFERILLFTHYLKEILGIQVITTNHIYTCFDALDLRSPENLPQTIRNAKSRSSWIDKDNNGISVTVKGRNKIKFWDKD